MYVFIKMFTYWLSHWIHLFAAFIWDRSVLLHEALIDIVLFEDYFINPVLTDNLVNLSFFTYG